MMLTIANAIASGLMIYVGIGLLYALYFVTAGIRKEPIEGLGIILRLMLIPAALLLWPYLLIKGKAA